MQSSSTILLQKVLWAKLQSWLKFTNGEGGRQYLLVKQPGKITITEQLDFTKWTFPILTIIFEEDLLLASTKKRIRVPYSDPELYRRLFAVVDYAAQNSFSDTMKVLTQAAQTSTLPSDTWKLNEGRHPS